MGRSPIPPEELAASINNSKYAANQDTPAWLKLWYTWDLEDSQYTELLNTVTRQWEQKEFNKPGEILHVVGIFLMLSHLGLRAEKLADTLHECRMYVDRLAVQDVWKWDDVNAVLFPDLGAIDGYLSHGFHGGDLTEFKEFRAYLKDVMQKTQLGLIPSVAKNLLETLVKNPSRFAEIISGNSAEDRTYNEISIFQHMSAKEFIDALLEIPNKSKRLVGEAIQQRYQSPIRSARFTEEKVFLRDLKDRIENVVRKDKGTMSAHVLETQVLSKVKIGLGVLEQRG